MNIVRGAGNIAGNIVDGTVNAVATVASVATGGLGGGSGSGSIVKRHSLDGKPSVVLKDKVTLTLKSTPERSALSTATLALKSGSMLKRNEQGVWQKRFCCLVPHLFLYYFDGDTAKDPQGVIDMEFLTDISVQSDNIIKIASSEDSMSRVFYFQADSAALGNQWASSMQRERYAVVKDERDAYQQLQDQFSGQLDFAFQQVETTSSERDRLQLEVNRLAKDQDEIEFILKKFALIVGMSEAEIPFSGSSASGMARCVEALLLGTDRLKASFESKIASDAEVRKQEQSALYDKIELLESQQSDAAHSIRLLEASVLQEKRDAEMRLKDGVAEIARLNAVVEQMQSEAGETEEKLIALHDQKKVLVKEVKSMRKKEQLTEDSLAQMAQANEELKRTVAELNAQMEEMKVSHQNALREAAAAASAAIASAAIASAAASTSTSGGVSADGTTSADLDQASSSSPIASPSDNNSNNISSEALSTSTSSISAGGVSSIGGVKASTSREALNSATTTSTTSSPSATSTSTNTTTTTSITDDIKLSRFMPSLSLFHKDKDEPSASTSTTTTTTAVVESESSNTTSTSDHKDNPSMSLHLPSLSFFNSSSSSSSSSSSTSTSGGSSSSSSSIFSSLTFSLDSDSSSSKADGTHNHSSSTTSTTTSTTTSAVVPGGGSLTAPRCYRCGGTVEGPKYSTCKCLVPAMTPEEAAPPASSGAAGSNRRSSLSGLFDMFGKNKDAPMADASSRAGSSGTGTGASSTSTSGATTAPSAPIGSSVFQAQLILDDESPVRSTHSNSTSSSTSGGNSSSSSREGAKSPVAATSESTNLLEL